MSDDVSGAVVTMKLTHLLYAGVATALTLVGGLWAVWGMTVGGVQTDVSAIRAVLDQRQTADQDTLKDSHAVEVDLRKELADLTATLRVTTTELSGLNGTVAKLDGSIKTVDDKLTSSIGRQENFERYVIAILGPPSQDSFTKTNFTDIWGTGADNAYFEIVKGGKEPLETYLMSITNPPTLPKEAPK